MIRELLKKIGPDFDVLAEEMEEIEQQVTDRLDKSVKLDEIDCVTFGLETDDGKIVKVYVNTEQSDAFEKALSEKLGEIDDLEEVLNELSKEYDIIDVEWPEEEVDDEAKKAEDPTMSTDGSESLNSEVYQNSNEKNATAGEAKPKYEGLTAGEQYTAHLYENDNVNSLERRLTTPTQLMVYNAILDLGIPEIALVRNPYRSAIIKGIREKALELNKNPTIKTALKWFIKRSLDQDSLVKNKKQHDADAKKDGKEDVNESIELIEGITQDFWADLRGFIEYVASDEKSAEALLNSQKLTALQKMSMSSEIARSNTNRIRTKLSTLVAAIMMQRPAEPVTEATDAVEVGGILTDLFQLADGSNNKRNSEQLLTSTAFKQFLTKSKVRLSQKFNGGLRSKLDQLVDVMRDLRDAEKKKAKPADQQPDLKESVQLNELVDDAKWVFTKDGDLVTISCQAFDLKLADEEMEKLIKGITNADAVVIKDHEEPTKKFVFSPRQKNVQVKQVGSQDSYMMKAPEVEKLTKLMGTEES